MSQAKVDIILQSWMERSARRLATVAEKKSNDFAKRSLLLSVEMLEYGLAPYRSSVETVRVESEEASRAAEEVGEAEAGVERSYERLWRTVQGEFYKVTADPLVGGRRVAQASYGPWDVL